MFNLPNHFYYTQLLDVALPSAAESDVQLLNEATGSTTTMRCAAVQASVFGDSPTGVRLGEAVGKRTNEDRLLVFFTMFKLHYCIKVAVVFLPALSVRPKTSRTHTLYSRRLRLHVPVSMVIQRPIDCSKHR